MLCKDCRHFKQWKSIDTAMCEKTGLATETCDRPCDDFVSKRQMTDEWGETTDGDFKRCD